MALELYHILLSFQNVGRFDNSKYKNIVTHLKYLSSYFIYFLIAYVCVMCQNNSFDKGIVQYSDINIKERDFSCAFSSRACRVNWAVTCGWAASLLVCGSPRCSWASCNASIRLRVGLVQYTRPSRLRFASTQSL